MNASVYCARCGALNQPQATTCFACGRSLTEPAPAGDARRLLGGRYRVARQLGVGGFGAVYQAEDTSLGHRLVAVKEMSPRGLSAEEAREATQAFEREALLLAGLSHPSLPRIYERFEEEGRWYLVMDFIEGETLEVYLDRQGGSLPVKEALALALQLTDVLGYLHSRQPPIIFRDLKPSNIIRQPDGQVALVDFGIARFFKPGQRKDTMAFGSPGYAAPEQYGKAQTTPRSDVFSLGALLHQMLTGIDPSITPFRFAPLTMPRPAGLSSLNQRMVEMDEGYRPPSMEIIRSELTALLDTRAPWRDDELALTGAYASPAGTVVGPWTAAGPVVTPAGYTSPFQPWATPQPAKKKRGRPLFWGGLAVAAFLIWQIISAAMPATSQSNFGASPGDFGGNGATTTTTVSSAVPVYSVAWSPDDTYLAAGGADDKIQIWTLSSSKPLVTLVTDSSSTTELAWSPNGAYLAALGGSSIDLWDASTEAFYVDAYHPAGDMSAFAWSPASDQLAAAFADGTVYVINVVTKVGRLLLTAQPGSTNVIAWSPNGKYIATGGTTDAVNIWDSVTGQPVYRDEGYVGGIDSIAWSPDSMRVAAADSSGTVRVWDAITGDQAPVYPGNASIINAIAWSPDGSHLAAGDQQGAVQVWLPGSATHGIIYTPQNAAVRAVAWSPNSTRIASASMDGTVQICDAFTGDNVGFYQQP